MRLVKLDRLCHAGSCPDSACLVTDDNDEMLLCLHSSQASRLTALSLFHDATGIRIQVNQSPLHAGAFPGIMQLHWSLSLLEVDMEVACSHSFTV